MILLAPLLLALAVQDTVRVPADSYADSATAELVRSARAARDRNERLVTAYTATATQRVGVGIRALSRDRMLYRQEMVARIAWKRDEPSTIEVVGAREGIPIAIRGDQVPEDLDDQLRGLVLNPAEDYLSLIGGYDSEDDGFVYPLKAGAEVDYKFAIGGTTTISLPTGKQIRLVELKVIPRRSEWRLITGTLWFDADTYGLVRLVFRPARPFEFRRDISEEDREDVPGWVNPTAEVKYVTLEYGLYENRWWMPRYVAIDATGGMGSWLNVPLRIERRYEDYEVEGGTPRPEGSTFRPAGTVRRRELDSIPDPVRRKAVADSIEKAKDECIDEATDRDRPDGVSRSEHRRQVRSEIRRCLRRNRDDSNLIVKIPEDSAALLTHPELGEPILAMGDLIDETELRSLGDALGALPKTPWTAQVQLPRGVSSLLQHARYNRVEALSLGASGRLDLGRLQVDGLARIGLADGVPNAELSVSRRTPNAVMALTGYRRLATANPETRPFGLVNSSTALFSQRDDGEYFRTLGVEWTAANTNSGWWSLRLYYERQRPARVETSASLPHLFDGSKLFRPNFQADSASQAGASLTLRGTKAVSRTLTLGAEANVQGGTGDYDFGRSSVTLRAFLAPPGPLAGAMTVSAGTSTGEVPLQSRFYLGGPATLRGYDGGVMAGSAYWTGRIEVGNAFPAARITAFSDIGWAGDRERFGDGKPLLAVGIGASFLDGLVRIDLARALRAPTGLRLDFYFDGIL